MITIIKHSSFIILLTITFLFLMIISCSTFTRQTKLQNDIEQLDREIMEYHDQAMPKMGKVLSLRKQLNQQIDTCEDEMFKYELQRASYRLTKADEDMMKWMHAYKTPVVNDSALRYLARQKEEIKLVRDEIFSGIEKAESIIKK